MRPAQPSPTARDDERAPPTLEARVEALASLAWKTQDDPARAASMARQAAALADSGDASPRARALVLAARARIATLEGDLDTAIRLGRSAIEALDSDAIWECRLLGEVAVATSLRGRVEEARPLYERGLELAKELGQRDQECRFLLNLSEVDSLGGHADRALHVAQQARALASSIRNRRFEGFALERQGAHYRVLGAYPEATASLLAAIELLETEDVPGNVATAYSNLANVYAVTGRSKQAIKAAESALAHLQDAPPSMHKGNALGALGLAYHSAGDLDAALEATERGLALRRELGHEAEAAASMVAIADIHLDAGRIDEAEAIFCACLDRVPEPRLALGCKAGLAQVCLARGDCDGALDIAQPLIAGWESIGELQSLAEACELVAKVEEACDRPAAALAHLRRVQKLRTEIFTSESDARLRHLQVTHELAQEREKAAAALRDLSRHVMESHENERKRVARDLHDDLSQRLALLAVQLDMLARTPPASPDALRERIDTLADSARVVEDHVHRISHQLHPATLEQLGLVAATRSVCAETALAYEIDIAVLADDLSKLPDEIELALYRIIQEVLRNAVRHGRAKSISVHLFEDAEGVCLQVRDEGIGFDPEASGAGLGLVGMRERAEHLGGRLTIRSAVGRGTFTEVCVPRPSDGA